MAGSSFIFRTGLQDSFHDTVTRLSRYLLPTEKQAPADAEALSHKLMVRAGLVRQLGAGLWTFMPAGWRAHENVAQIVREEMDAIGCQEMLMPVLNPAELWQRSGRYAIDEVFKLQDRKGAEMVLAITHEEVITFHVSSIVRSYRQLPFSAYHFQTKERDEPRPRAGVLRTREFIMKDAYTFDRDRAGLDEHYEHFRGAYDRIFDRAGLEWYRVESDVGMMGAVRRGRERRRAGAGLRRQRRGRERRAGAGRAARAPRRARGGADPRPRHDRRGGRLARPARGRAAEGLSRHRRGPRPRARGPARRPSRQRHQARQRARRDVPGRPGGRVRPAHRPGRLDGPRRRRRARAARRRRRPGALRLRRQP